MLNRAVRARAWYATVPLVDTPQECVATNLGRIEELRAEAAVLEAGARLDPAGGSAPGLELRPPNVQQGCGALAQPGRPGQTFANAACSGGARAAWEPAPGQRAGGVGWLPAAFSSALGPQTLIAVEAAGVPWVLFRDSKGRAACVKDECAHRACPLSLVRGPCTSTASGTGL